LNLREILVRPVRSSEERRYQDLMHHHHYLGALPKIGETLWYVAAWRNEWVALLSFSASALKCTVRDRWIGWDFRLQYGRLKLVVNNSRFLIVPEWHVPNLGSRILALCQKRLCKDWQRTFGHPVVLLETFVDPQRFRGTVYKADNWVYVGDTKGFRRTTLGYTATPQSPKMVFVKPLKANARELLSQTILPPPYSLGDSKIMLNADQMLSLPAFFKGIPDPRRRTAASIEHCPCHCSRGRAVWDARIQSHLGLGRQPESKSAGAFQLPSRKRPVRCSKRVHHPGCFGSRRPAALGPRIAALERGVCWRR